MIGSNERNIVILVADLSGYTALTEAHGNASAAKIINRYSEIAKESLHTDSRVLELVGDEILFESADATSIVKTALRLVNKIESEPFFPTVHAGIHSGKVLEQEGRCYRCLST
ncbi:MAG: hypothetical protein WBY88_12115 [Desulfosarcina sp.]